MSNEALPPTFTLVLAGRPVEFKRAGIGQVIMLQRRAFRKLKTADGIEEDTGRNELSTTALVEVFDFIDTLIVSEEDRQYVEDGMLSGEIDWEDVVGALGGGPRNSVADDEVPPVKKRAPRKSPKAASAAQTVANRGRAKR